MSRFAVVGLAAALALFSASAFAEQQVDVKAWHRLVGIAQYLEGDYPAAVASKSAEELEEQRAFISDGVKIAESMGAPGEGFLQRLQSIKARVDKGEDPQGVSRDCAALAEDLVRAGGLSRSPKASPDLKLGQQQFEANCATCHGADGKAQTQVGQTLTPPPASFHDPARMAKLTPYKAFNTISNGIPNTAMMPFPQLDDATRWNIGFYLFTLRQPACDHDPKKASLEQLATSTDDQLATEFGKDEVACLRRKMPSADEENALLIARNGVDEAMKLGAAGDANGAKQALLDAYLNGIEPVEPLLRSRDAALVKELEAGFMDARIAAEKNSPHLQDEGRQLLTLIDKARKTKGGADAVSVFLQSLLIVVREGFEATVVIAALLAVLKKMKQTSSARVVHIGWVSALIVGAIVYAFAHKLIAGANREWMEGVVALVAVGMLLYAALWLNARSNTRKWMNKLRSDMQGALGKGSVFGLFFISFSAVSRESLETALFLQGLSIDSAQGAMWGAIAGCVLLVALVVMVNRVGYVLPMKPLFTASTVVLFVTAVVLLGKGLHALQEVGALPLAPIKMFELEFLGIFPDAISLVPQIVLALAPLAWRFRRRKEQPEPPAGEPKLT